MKRSGFRSFLPATLPLTEEDLISSEFPQGFVDSSKPFSCGRKHTNIQDAQIYSQHEIFQNFSVVDTKHLSSSSGKRPVPLTQCYQHD